MEVSKTWNIYRWPHCYAIALSVVCLHVSFPLELCCLVHVERVKWTSFWAKIQRWTNYAVSLLRSWIVATGHAGLLKRWISTDSRWKKLNTVHAKNSVIGWGLICTLSNLWNFRIQSDILKVETPIHAIKSPQKSIQSVNQV